MSNRAVLTKEAMDRFESDVEEGKVVDIEDYLKSSGRLCSKSYKKSLSIFR